MKRLLIAPVLPSPDAHVASAVGGIPEKEIQLDISGLASVTEVRLERSFMTVSSRACASHNWLLSNHDKLLNRR